MDDAVPDMTSSYPTSGGDKVPHQTSGACDQCRVKKIQCDGVQSCGNCQADDISCMYTAPKAPETQKFNGQMRVSADEALQQLYWACRNNSGFPGQIPDESTGRITTADILRGLGLVLDQDDPADTIENSTPSDAENLTSSEMEKNSPVQVEAENPMADTMSQMGEEDDAFEEAGSSIEEGAIRDLVAATPESPKK